MKNKFATRFSGFASEGKNICYNAHLMKKIFHHLKKKIATLCGSASKNKKSCYEPFNYLHRIKNAHRPKLAEARRWLQ